MFELKSPPEAHYTVYRLTAPNGKVYIGQTGVGVVQRWRAGYKDRPVGRAIKKYGWENFKKDILCDKLTKEGSEKLEKWFVDYYDSTNPEKGYNSFTGGARKDAKLNDLTKEKVRRCKLQQYEEDPALRKRLSEKTMHYFSGNPENAMKSSQLLKHIYAEHPERRREISRSMRAYLSKEENQKFVHSCTKPKPVLCIETGLVYSSQASAEKQTGYSSVHKVCAGRLLTSGGYHWRYLTEEEKQRLLSR